MYPLFTCSKVELFSELVLATVDERISPDRPGRVKCQGTYWPARLYQQDCSVSLDPCDRVFVVGIEGLTLLILPSRSASV